MGKWRPLADRAVEGLAVAFPDPVAVTTRVATAVAAFTQRWQG
ncbi:hypothetical protein MPHLCCUG_04536 [Mycolicibacterium phlei]|nr:hypothetical protein MPHLCCUG_04536 [Mycolicibacterium phlei]